MSIKHGWQKLMGPVVATKTDGNVIKELNWQPPLSVYSKAIEKDIHLKITNKNFSEHAFSFPFGMHKEGSEMVIRDPIRCNKKGEIICIGDVPQNSVLNILKGEASELIHAAELATHEAQLKINKQLKHTLVIDCISRLLFLKDDYIKELNTINSQCKQSNKEALPQGVLSIGEMSSGRGGRIDFHSKTLILSTLH